MEPLGIDRETEGRLIAAPAQLRADDTGGRGPPSTASVEAHREAAPEVAVLVRVRRRVLADRVGVLHGELEARRVEAQARAGAAEQRVVGAGRRAGAGLVAHVCGVG